MKDKRARKLLRRFRKIEAQGEARLRWARARKFRKKAIEAPARPQPSA